MIDLSPFNNYIIEDSETYDSMAESEMDRSSYSEWFNNQIERWLNCSYMPTGKRILQTNDKRYHRELTTTIHMIEKYSEFIDDDYNKLINRHFSNLEFERINGLEYNPYATGKLKQSSSKKKSKQSSIDFGDKPKKETAAERKLKAHAAKISKLTFTIKPANNDNTI